MLSHTPSDVVRGTQCYHCGASCDESSVSFEQKLFCCTGCSIVHQLLKSDTVCEVMSDEEVARSRFSRKPIPRFEYLEDESVRAALITFEDGRQAHCVFKLPTIHCASCIWTLENLFRIDPAIIRTEVNFLKKTLSVSFFTAEISLRQVVELITRLGYEPEIRLKDQEGNNPSTNSTLRSLYYKIGVAGFAFGNVMLFAAPDYLARISSDGALLSPAFAQLFAILSVALSLPVLLYSASDYYINSWYSLRDRTLSLDVPIAMGITALFARSVYEVATGTGTGYFDSFTGLVFFLLIARVFQAKSFDTLSFERNYTSFFPLSVSVRQSGRIRVIPLSKLREEDVIVVRNGELVPADSVLLSSHLHIDYSFVSGESEVVELLRGATVYAGGKVVGAAGEFTVTKSVSHSYLTQLWNNSVFSKEKQNSLVDISNAFARYFTIVVLIVAIATALYWLPDTSKALSTFTAVLIVACPCALTLAAPFTFGAALSIFAKAQFFLRNVGVVADVASINTMVFDKTGTLTQSTKSSIEFVDGELSEEERRYVITTAQHSLHPLSTRIVEMLSDGVHDEQLPETEHYQEYPGRGAESRIFGHHILLGSADLVRTLSKAQVPAFEQSGIVHVVIDNEYKGYFRIRMLMRDGMAAALQTMKSSAELYVLSGDGDQQRKEFTEFFPDDHLVFKQSPQDKLDFVQALQAEQRFVAMVGDGINDAGALRQSHVGIAVSESSTSFTPASDAIISADNLYRLPEFIAFAKYSIRVLKIAFAVSVVYNVFGLYLACGGQLSPMFAAIFMPLSSWSVVGIAYGLMRIRERSITKPKNVQRAFPATVNRGLSEVV